jgi:hypothetical protein
MAAPTNAAKREKALANPEPSTHGTKRTLGAPEPCLLLGEQRTLPIALSRLPTKTISCDHGLMSSNIEPLAREMTERICRRNGMPEADIPGWVDLHWQCAAAMLEAGVMDEDGEWITDKDVHLGIEAYRERFARQG